MGICVLVTLRYNLQVLDAVQTLNGCNSSVHFNPLTLCLPVSSADNLGKQFGPRSGPTNRRAWSGSKLFDILMVFLKEFFQKVHFEKNQQTTKNHEKLPSRQWVNLDGRRGTTDDIYLLSTLLYLQLLWQIRQTCPVQFFILSSQFSLCLLLLVVTFTRPLPNSLGHARGFWGLRFFTAVRRSSCIQWHSGFFYGIPQ